MSFKLEDIAEFQKGFAFKSKDFIEEGRLIVKVSNLTDSTIDKSTCVRIDEEIASNYDKYELLEDDIIITTVGSWPTNPASVVGKVIKVPRDINKALLNQNAVRIRATGENNQKYLYYMLRNNGFRHYIVNTAQGSANQASITQADIKNYKFELPSIEEQKSIAKILSDLDNKIEVNNKINKRLEDMSQSIFKYWFVDFEFPNEEGKPYKSSGGEMVESELGMIPKGWEVSQLKELIQNIKNSTKAGEHLKELKYVPIDSMSMKCVTLNNYKPYEEAKSSLILFDKYDILIGAMRVYFHRVNLAPFKGITRTTTFVLRPYSKYDISYALFLMNLESTINYANQGSKGSTMPYAVWDNGLDSMKFILPCSDLRQKFNDIIMPTLNKMMKLSTENEKLSNLRDTLLPKLMSGEIRVPIDK